MTPARALSLVGRLLAARAHTRPAPYVELGLSSAIRARVAG